MVGLLSSGAGSGPAASNFLLLRQKKVTKVHVVGIRSLREAKLREYQKATRSLGPYAALRATCAARLRRGSAELAFGSNNCGPDPASICAARPSQDGASGCKYKKTNTNTNKDTPWRVLVSSVLGIWFSAVWLFSPPPSVCAEERRARRIRAGTCLSEASLCQTPPGLSTAGCPKRSAGTQTVGSPFFSLGFFGEAKKSKSPAGANPGPGT